MWTDDRVETLIRCAKEGKSFSDCAVELGPEFTRSMVAGKARRMDVGFHGGMDHDQAVEAARKAWRTKRNRLARQAKA